MRNGIVATTIFLLLLFVSQAHAQLHVYIDATADDIVGSRLVYAVKESIRRSAGMSLVESEQNAALSVRIVTMNPTRDENGSIQTVYSAVWTMRTLHERPVNMYLTQTVGICGQNRIAGCADALVADTDKQASFVTKIFQYIMDKDK